jgi:hypothetical protein
MRRTYHWLRNFFRCTERNSYVTWVMWNLIFCLFGCKIGGFAPNVPSAQKSFWMNLMVLLGDELNWKLVLDHLETVLI